ncbi:hypothetical protein [Enterococcus faecalis]|uniref:hypothetical protein n=1 Tax=Enterococcus faecalis TaxID=1351 RepID=UPI003CC639CA
MDSLVNYVEEYLKDKDRPLTLDELLVSLGIPITNMNRGVLSSKLKYNKKIEHSYQEIKFEIVNTYRWKSNDIVDKNCTQS